MGTMSTPTSPNGTANTPTAAELRDLCVELVQDAAGFVAKQRDFLTRHGSVEMVAQTKTSEVDPVTAVDKGCEERVVGKLSQLRPGDGVIGEEGASKPSETGVEWVIDPIDGTVNFIYGLPAYAVSVGVAVHGELVAGAVADVARGITYFAARGHGAFVLSDATAHPLRTSRASRHATALVETGFSYDSGWRGQQAQILTTLLPQVRDIRRMGSAALDLCRVAEGSADAYYEHGTHPWDYAAGAVIAAEAGAVVHHPGLRDRGGDGALMYACAPGLAESFPRLLEEAGAMRVLGAGA